jgi:sugar phosphate isomerase/epimerase
METKRRDFLKVLGGTALVSSVGLVAASCGSTSSNKEAEKMNPEDTQNNVELKLSCQEGIAVGETLAEKLDFMEKNGFVGLEPWGADLTKRVPEFEKALNGRNIQISAICAGFSGVLIAEDEKLRKQAMDSIKEMLPACGALKATGLIVVPAFNDTKIPPFVEARKLLVDELKELGEIAAKYNTKIILEPLNRSEAWFLRQVADATAIAKDVDSAGVGVMGDFWHMKFEEPSDYAAFLSAGNYLTHVHIASRGNRNMPGEAPEVDIYIDGMKGLKFMKYSNYISFECGSVGDKKVTIPAAVKLIKEQWANA